MALSEQMWTNNRRAALAVRFLHYRCAYGARIALDDVSLEMPSHCLTAVMGPGGSGKSTLLRVLAGTAMPPDYHAEGELAINAKQRRFLPQPARIEIGGSSLRDARFDLLAHQNALQAKFAEILTAVPTADNLLDPVPANPGLPLDAQRLLLLLWALEGESDLVLLDEPLAGLGGAARELAAEWILHHRHAATIVIVTHHLGVARNLADQVVLMVDGKLCEAAPCRSFFEAPQHPRTKQYLASGS